MQVHLKTDLLGEVGHRLSMTVRLGGFLLALAFFATQGLVDAMLRLLWPKWRTSEVAPRWVSTGVAWMMLRLFPQVILLPFSWRGQYRVLRLEYPRVLHPGETGWVELTLQNGSRETWSGGTVHPCRLGVVNPPDASAFCSPAKWPSPTRPAELPPGAEIRPSMVFKFKVPIRAPQTPGDYRETWGLLVEGRNWLPTHRGLDIRIAVRHRK